jgi:hypothetical protein
MTRARRRDEWDRLSTLLKLVDERSGCGEGFEPREQLGWFPPGLITDEDRRAVDRARRRNQTKVSINDVAEAMGLKT